MSLNWYKSLEWYNKNKKVKKVLFVCSANAGRSPSAEYYFNNMTHWWSGVKAFSRGLNTNLILSQLKAKGVDIKALLLDPEARKAIGDRESVFLAKHKARQISSKDIADADIILALEKEIRDVIRKEYPGSAHKIFTLKGFVTQTDSSNVDIDVHDVFIPYALRKAKGIEQGKVGYMRYMQEHARLLKEIESYVRKLIEIIYLLRSEKE